MGTANPYPFLYGRFLQNLTGTEEVFYLSEVPGITNGSPANHDSIHFIFHSPASGFLYALSISVTKYWNINASISHHLPYQRPVGSTLMHLCTGTTMDG